MNYGKREILIDGYIKKATAKIVILTGEQFLCSMFYSYKLNMALFYMVSIISVHNKPHIG